MTTTRTQQRYVIAPSVREQLPETIAAAYRAAGLTPPTQGAELLARLQAEPTAEQTAKDLAVESVTVTDLEAWTEQALGRIQRAQAVDTLLRAVRGHREHAMRHAGHELIADALSDLSKPFADAAKRLSKAAAALPAENPLDLDAVIQTDATAAMREATTTLAVLGAIGSALGTVPAGELHATLRDLLHVVDVPEVPLAQIDRMNRQTLNPDEQRDRVRRLADHAERHGVDRALIGVARGEYGDAIVLSLPTSRTDLRGRHARALTAVSAIVADSTGTPRRDFKPMHIVF